MHNKADSFGANTRKAILSSEYVPVLLQRTERWQYELSAVDGRKNATMTYAANDKDTVQDQIVNRVTRKYWRPLTEKPTLPSAKRNMSLIMPEPTSSATTALEEPNAEGEQAKQPCAKPCVKSCCTKRSLASKTNTPKKGRRVARAYHHEHTRTRVSSEEELRSPSGRRLLSSSPGRDVLRQQAHDQLMKQAEKMKKRAEMKQTGGLPLPIGAIVHLRLEDVDRGKLDNFNATLVVLDVTAKQNYTVGNRAGIYKEKVFRSYLTLVPNATPEMVGLDQLLSDYEDELLRDDIPRVGIRKIAAVDSVSGGQGMLVCHCKGQCNTNKCSCFRAGSRLCTSRCHRNNTLCSNHEHS